VVVPRGIGSLYSSRYGKRRRLAKGKRRLGADVDSEKLRVPIIEELLSVARPYRLTASFHRDLVWVRFCLWILPDEDLILEEVNFIGRIGEPSAIRRKICITLSSGFLHIRYRLAITIQRQHPNVEIFSSAATALSDHESQHLPKCVN